MVPQRFKSIPRGWRVLPFVDAVQDKTSGNPKIKSNEYLDDGLLPVVDQGQSPIAGYVDDAVLACREEVPCILFGDHTKIFKYVEHPFALGADGVKVLAPKEEFDKRFLFHYLNTVRLPDNAGYSRHFKFLKETWVPQPPLKEQKRIAAILDKADVIRRKRQQAIQLADEFLRSVFLDMFGDPVLNPKGWSMGKFGDIADINPGLTKIADETEVSFVPMSTVSENSDEIDVTETKLFSEARAGFTPFQEGDVLFAKITPCMENGKAGIARNLKNEVGFGSTEFHVFRPHLEVYAEFIYTLIHLRSFRNLAASRLSGAVGHKRVPKDFLAEFSLILPPESLIEKYRNIYLKSQDRLSALRSSLILENELFASISQRAFRGDL